MGDFRFEVWPTEYPVITQHFGVNPRNYAQFGLPGHDGVDIKAPTGSKVFCVAPGEVFQVYTKPTGHNYGIHVRVQHQDDYQTIYGHLQKALVREGQIVEAGTMLGLADNTGNSFGSHLHLGLKKKGVKYENWPYNLIDPTPFLLPLLGWQQPAGPYMEGWVLTDTIFSKGQLAQVNAGGATLYIDPELNKFIPAGTIVIIRSRNEPFTLIQVPKVAIGMKEDPLPKPAPEPPPIVATVDGWAWKRFLTIVGKQAIVGNHGINLRAGPDRSATNIGMIKANSTVTLTGPVQDLYVPVRVRRDDFVGPVDLAEPPPKPDDSNDEEGYQGWVLSQYLSPAGYRLALTSRLGINLRNKPGQAGHNIGLVKAFATVRLAGPTRNDYTPVLVRKTDVLNPVNPMPDIEQPDTWPSEEPPSPDPKPIHDTTPGWSFTNGLYVAGSEATVAQYGSNLREAPKRDAKKLGFIPAKTKIIVTGSPQGEYTPVRVDDELLEPPDEKVTKDLDSQTMGRARIGLHASADPQISDLEHQEFSLLRPGIIKVMSFHNSDDISRLAEAHPEAQFIIRAFLSINGRNITPAKFLDDTLRDVERTLKQLKGRSVVVELHNEPNVIAEGLGSSWSDGATFSVWWRELLKRYRRALPGTRFIYPGLSPGTTIIGTKIDHVQFLEASRAAAEAADGIGIHAYWSTVHPMSHALDLVDDYISRFRSRPLWITEASHNHGVVSPTQLSKEYLHFWRELQNRPVVRGVTFFIASASDPKYANEVWLGKGIAKLVGRR